MMTRSVFRGGGALASTALGAGILGVPKLCGRKFF